MLYPALHVQGVDAGFALAIAQDFSPSAAEEDPGSITIFFATDTERARAREAIGRAMPDAVLSDRDVDDQDWARRSQEGLEPITVGRITVAPPWSPVALDSGSQPRDHFVVIIQPSMGFGTGHHATTRLCLAALQTVPLRGAIVLDVGTGSGVLAIAARVLGAAEALGIDVDPDAIASAQESLLLNADVSGVRFQLADLESAPLPQADVMLANLTGAHLVRCAATLTRALASGGVLIVSGLLQDEREKVVTAFGGVSVADSTCEDEWACLTLKKGPSGPDRG